MDDYTAEAHALLDCLVGIQRGIQLRTGVGHAICEVQVSDDYALALDIPPGTCAVFAGVVVRPNISERDLRAALAEALDGWQALLNKYGRLAGWSWDAINPGERIAELRVKFLRK